ncbi:hypothetical protein G7046_g544 [Stylonectria norvegica]|nr:hypothetical protein G7046_g544 [Stylonectria norvegica]
MLTQKKKGPGENEDHLWHLRIRPQCDICGFDFNLGDQFLGLVSDVEAAASIPFEIYGPFDFPEHGYKGQTVKGWWMCRYAFCNRCTVAPDSATVHPDCFNLFRQRCLAEDGLFRLWTASAWRQPWTAVTTLRLSPRTDVARGTRLAAEICDIHKMNSLPLELAEMIYTFSHLSTIWRYAAVLQLVDALSAAGADELVSMPILKISAWSRSNRPIILPSVDKPFIRLTMDSWGLKSIERLGEAPEISGKQGDALVYIVEPESSFTGVTFGICHLSIPEATKPFEIWDNPGPPPLASCALYKIAPYPPRASFIRLRTLDLEKYSGLTFFIGRDGDTYAIHAHTSSNNTAESTYRRLPWNRQLASVWVYLPLPARERILTFGVRLPIEDGYMFYSPCYLLRTALCGDIMLGPYREGKTQDFTRNTGSGCSLVHDVLESDPISIIGCNPREEDCTTIAPGISYGAPPLEDAFFSSAPLAGIFLEYNTGAQQALGQCRFGMDPMVAYTSPSHICAAHSEHRLPGRGYDIREVRVTATSSPEHHDHCDDKLEWECFSMTGRLYFWFTLEESLLTNIIYE